MPTEKRRKNLGQDNPYETTVLKRVAIRQRRVVGPTAGPAFCLWGFQAMAWGGDPQGEPE